MDGSRVRPGGQRALRGARAGDSYSALAHPLGCQVEPATESDGACLRAATSLDFAGLVHANREIQLHNLMSVILSKDGATLSVRAEVKADCRCLIPQPKS